MNSIESDNKRINGDHGQCKYVSQPPHDLETEYTQSQWELKFILLM